MVNKALNQQNCPQAFIVVQRYSTWWRVEELGQKMKRWKGKEVHDIEYGNYKGYVFFKPRVV